MPAAAVALAAAAGLYVYSPRAPHPDHAASAPELPFSERAAERGEPTDAATDRPTGLSPSAQAKIAQLLEVAEAHAAIGRLADPPGSNAYDAYKLVLRLDPNNERAKAGMKAIERELKRSREQ
jgi:hypothetical protein